MVNPDPKFQDKKRYVRVEHDGSWFVSSPADAQDFMMSAKEYEPEAAYKVTDVWMTPAKFEGLPEFTGF